jgi:cell division protein FtsW
MIVGQATATRSPMSGGHFIPLFVITVALALTTLGLVMLFSAGAVTKSGPHALVSKQAIWLGLSIVAGGISAFVNLEWLHKRAWLLYGICALALVLVLVPGFGVKVNGAQRWLGLGPLRLQPSEFAKIGLVLILAVYLSSNQREIKSLCRGFVYPSLILGLVLGLIMLQPDFGTTFLCGAVGATMMFLAGVSLRWLLPVAGLAVSGFALLVYLDPVRIRRVTSFLDVEANANDSAYQLWQGMLAFGVGGIDGVGLGKGRQQMHFLPEAHTDFIFSVIGEELGLIFSLGIVACFLALFVLVAWRLREAPNLYLFLIGSGAILAIALQAVINVGVVTGSMPTKGMSLPFISYGGSNLMVTFVLIGLILNVFRSWGGPVLPRSREL